MYIFYDFETSSRDLVGQILGYSFIVTDAQLKVKDELTGWVKLSRTQCPEIDAILINQIDLRVLQDKGESEVEAADRIYWFLDKYADKKPLLTGFNSNSFDLGFLRNLLIRNGRNPYFFGKIKNRDVLHWMRHLAFAQPDVFPWQIGSNEAGYQYYSFKLEAMATAFGCLDMPQSHDAREDVLLTIAVIQAAEKKMKVKFGDYLPSSFDGEPLQNATFEMDRQKVPVYPDGADALLHFSTRYWAPLLAGKTDRIMVDVERYLDEGAEAALRYFNLNKHGLTFESPSPDELAIFKDALTAMHDDPILKGMDYERYFQLIHKSWDIEYQIHEMGMERIDDLRLCIEALMSKPDEYAIILQQLIQKRASGQSQEKDGYLIQLFNRFYLNNHPHPDPAHLAKYLTPRYITGTLLRDPAEFMPFATQFERIKSMADAAEKAENKVIAGLIWYFDIFRTRV